MHHVESNKRISIDFSFKHKGFESYAFVKYNSLQLLKELLIVLHALFVCGYSFGFFKSAFFTDSFGKLVYCLSVLFALCWIEFNVTFINFITFSLHNHCLYKYQVLCQVLYQVAFEILSLKNPIYKKNVKLSHTLAAFWCWCGDNRYKMRTSFEILALKNAATWRLYQTLG